jgi:hypothetical protein
MLVDGITDFLVFYATRELLVLWWQIIWRMDHLDVFLELLDFPHGRSWATDRRASEELMAIFLTTRLIGKW